LLGVKYAACAVYTFALVAFIGLSALLVGLLRQGAGGMFVFAPLEGIFAMYDFLPGLGRYLGSLPLLGLSLMTVTSIGFLLSCCKMKPAAATIVTLSIFLVDMIFRGIPYFESIRPWFLTAHMSSWLNIFQPNIPVLQMLQDYAYLLGVDLTVVVIGAAIFQSRDFKS
jgi:ABC-2 type transport system permease protein